MRLLKKLIILSQNIGFSPFNLFVLPTQLLLDGSFLWPTAPWGAPLLPYPLLRSVLCISSRNHWGILSDAPPANGNLNGTLCLYSFLLIFQILQNRRRHRSQCSHPPSGSRNNLWSSLRNFSPSKPPPTLPFSNTRADPKMHISFLEGTPFSTDGSLYTPLTWCF